MKNLLGLCAVSILGAGLLATACSGDDSSGGSSAGTGGVSAAGKGGASGGTTATGGKGGASGGTTATAGKGGGATTAGTGGASGAAPGGAGEGGTMTGEAGEGGTGGTGPSIPAPPALGAQIDRMGRPGVNTALTDPFDIVTGKTEDQVKDAYNAEADPTKWSTEFKAYIKTNLAILDALDTTGTAPAGCGNQLLYSATTGYDTLAGVLVDDRLYLNTKVPAGGTLNCTQYLGVEANAVGTTNSDCGGRTLSYDVIDTTYSVLAIGALTGVSDGIASDSSFTTTFPFLAAPQ